MHINNDLSPIREIYNAINTGDISLLKKLLDLQTYVEQLSWKAYSDWTDGWRDYAVEKLMPLAKATELEDIEIVKLLIKSSCSLADFRFPLGEALCVACEAGNIALVTILLDAKAAIGHIGGTIYMNDSSFFNYAICEGHLEIIQTLHAFGFDINGDSDEGGTPLMASVLKNNILIVKYLVELGADVNQTDDSQWFTALMQASASGYREIFDYLEPLSSPEVIKLTKEHFSKYS